MKFNQEELLLQVAMTSHNAMPKHYETLNENHTTQFGKKYFTIWNKSMNNPIGCWRPIMLLKINIPLALRIFETRNSQEATTTSQMTIKYTRIQTKRFIQKWTWLNMKLLIKSSSHLHAIKTPNKRKLVLPFRS